MASATATMAAEAAAPDAKDSEEPVIVVTGTMLRGVAPAGTNVIGVTSESVAATGATTTAQLLQSIPQLGSFNSLNTPSGRDSASIVNRPNLRNLPGNNTAGGSTTLVLMDGHRMVGAGVASTTPDPDVIPPGALERVEIVPDGGSAIYGADAVAGVMNFITRRKFEGMAFDGHYGIADNYYQMDINGTVGRDWGSGGLYLSYSYAKNDAIFGRDRDYIHEFPGASGTTTTTCNPGNVAIGSTTYALSSTGVFGAAGTLNQCDVSDDATMYPAQHRHSAFGRFAQDIGDKIQVDVQAFYTNRVMNMASGAVRPGQPLTVNVASGPWTAYRVGAETTQSVYTSIGDAHARDQHISLSTWGVTPTITADIGSGWQVRLMGNIGGSTTENVAGTYNSSALTSAITAGTFNPYDPDAASNATALSTIQNYETYGLAKQRMENVRLVLDGDVLTLPGGAVKVAVGAEYLHESWKSRYGDTTPLLASSLPTYDLGRKVKAAFGEIVIPLVGADNAMTGIKSLTFSAAGRYDDYSDVGDTFNPKLGLTWKPTEWLSVRGAWGKSFNAPSLADAASASATTVFVLPQAFFPVPSSLYTTNGGTYPVPGGSDVVYVVRGNSPGIRPQKSKSWSLGFDMKPPVIDGLNIGVTYWNMNVSGVIGIPDGSKPAVVYGDYPQVVTTAPGASALNALNNPSFVYPYGPVCHTNATPCSVYAIVDIRKNNLGDLKLSGLDISLDYKLPTSFGSVSLAANANYELTRKFRTAPSRPYANQLGINTTGRLHTRATLGAEVGNLLGQVTWNHSSGYILNPAVGYVPQSKVSGYDTFNLFFRYNVNGEGAFKDLVFTLNVDNVFDAAPPQYRGGCLNTPNQCGYTNGATLGRLMQIGVSKKF